MIEYYDNVMSCIIANENRLISKKKEQEWLQECLKKQKKGEIMKLKVKLQNFKGWANLEFDFNTDNKTILYGKSGSGKSIY